MKIQFAAGMNRYSARARERFGVRKLALAGLDVGAFLEALGVETRILLGLEQLHEVPLECCTKCRFSL